MTSPSADPGFFRTKQTPSLGKPGSDWEPLPAVNISPTHFTWGENPGWGGRRCSPVSGNVRRRRADEGQRSSAHSEHYSRQPIRSFGNISEKNHHHEGKGEGPSCRALPEARHSSRGHFLLDSVIFYTFYCGKLVCV